MGLGNLVGDLTGGLIGESSTEKAAKRGQRLSQQWTDYMIRILDDAFDFSAEDIQPYIDAGQKSLDEFMQWTTADPNTPALEMFNFDPSQLGTNPAYKWRLEQGLQATNRAQAANRALTSGNRMMALQDYAQGAASQEYENEWQRQLASNAARNATAGQQYTMDADRFRAMMDRLYNTSGRGLNAATTLAGLKAGTAANIGNVATGNVANQFAAGLMPAQERQNFASGLMQLGGTILGGGSKPWWLGG